MRATKHDQLALAYACAAVQDALDALTRVKVQPNEPLGYAALVKGCIRSLTDMRKVLMLHATEFCLCPHVPNDGSGDAPIFPEGKPRL